MTDTLALINAIERAGLKRKFLAEKLGITVYGLQLKIENKNQFKAGEIAKLCECLNITSLQEKERIFFAKNVDKKSTEPDT